MLKTVVTKWTASLAVCCLVLTTVVLTVEPAAATEINGSGDAFIQTTYTEVGAKANASFGSAAAPPAGYHGTNPTLGFVTDRDRDGWGVTVDDGDFFVPGTPYEGWGIEVGGSVFINNHVGTAIAGAFSNPTTGAVHSVDWDATAPAGGIQVAQTYSTGINDQLVHMDVTLTNTTAGSLSNIYYWRGVDPDNNQPANGDFTTTQLIESQSAPASVSASQADGSYIALRSFDTGARAHYQPTTFLTDPTSIASIHDGTDTNYTSTVGSTAFVDSPMDLTVSVGSLAAGESATLRVTYFLSSYVPSADLETSATAPAIAAPGETTSLTLTITNSGPDAASSAVAQYTPPTGVLVDVGSLPANCSGAATGPISCTTASLASGSQSDFTIPVVIPSNATPSSTIVGGTTDGSSTVADPDGASNVPPAIPVGPAEADIEVTVSDPAAIVPGTSGDVTIDIENLGPSDTDDNTVVVYTPPTGTTIDMANLPTGCVETAPADGTATCTTGPLTDGGTDQFIIPILIPSGATPGSTYTGGSASGTNPDDPTPGNNVASSSAPVAGGTSDLSTVVSDPGPIVPGEGGTVTLTTSNAGASDAENVDVVYTPPSGVTIDMANIPAGCTADSPSSGSVTCDLGTIANGANNAVNIPIFVDSDATPSTTLTTGDTAGATSDSTDPNGDTVAAELTTGAAEADIEVTVTAPAAIIPGESGDVTIDIENLGSSDTDDNTVVIYTPPTGTTIDMANLPTGCVETAPADGTATCTTGPLTDGGTDQFIIPILVPSDTAPSITLTGGSAVGTNPDDTTTGNNTAASTVGTATLEADLSTAVSDPGPLAPGEGGNVILTTSNAGPSDAENVDVVYTPPTGVTIDMANLPAGCTADSPSSGSVTCDLGTITSGGSNNASIPVFVDSDATPSTTLTTGDTAGATSDSTDPNGDTVAAELTTGAADADIEVTVTAPAAIIPGESGDVTIDIENLGSSDTDDNTVVVYTPPTGTSVDMANLPTGCVETAPADGTATCTTGPLTDGGTDQFIIPIVVSAGATPSTTLTGGSAVGSNPDDATTGNNTAASTVDTAAAVSNLSTDVSDPGPIVPGQGGTVSLTTSNAGPSSAENVDVVYTPPTGVSVDIANLPAGCTGADPAGPITCDLGTIANGANNAASIPVFVDSDATPSTTLSTSDTAGATSDSTDPNGDTVAAELTTGVEAADIQLVVTDPAAIPPGQTADVLIDVTNAGPSDTDDNTVVVYTPPTGTSIDSANLPTGCAMTTPADGTATCDVAALVDGSTTQLAIPVRIPANAAPSTSFTGGSATSSNPDDATPENESSAVDSAPAASDLSTVVSDPGPIVPGEGGAVTLTTSNAGPSDAENVDVVYTPPAGVSVDIANLPAGCTGADPAGPITCDLGTITSGGSNNASIPVFVDSDATPSTTLTTGDTAGATSDSTDPDGDTVAAALSTGAAEADIEVTVTAPAAIIPGESGDVTIDIENLGSSDTDDNTVVVYTPPTGTTIDSANLPTGCAMTTPADGTATCTTGPLADGGTDQFIIPILVASDTAPSVTLTGGSAVGSNPDDPDTSNNTVVSGAPIGAAESDLSTVASDPGPIVPGEGGTVTLTTSNAGPSSAENVDVVYTPPTGVSVDIANLPAGCTGADPAGPITCDLGTIANGANNAASIPVFVDSDATPSTTLTTGDTAGATSDSTDPNGDTVAAELTTAATEADLSVTASDPGPLSPGTGGDVTLSIDNAGPSEATNVSVVYTPPADVTVDIANLPAGCTANTPSAGSVTCTPGDFDAGGTTIEIDIPITVAPDATPQITLTGGDVDVASDATDPTASDSTNVSSDVTTGAPGADLQITVVSVPTLQPGDTGIIDIDVYNSGPSDGGSVDVEFVLPPGVVFDTTHGNPNGCVESGGVVTCTIAGPIADLSTTDVLIPVLMLEHQPTSGPIAATDVTLENQAVADPNSGNDAADGTPVLDLTGDSDGDGISDADEIDPDGTGTPLDTDGDGTPDYLDVDSDNDGILDEDEAPAGDTNTDTDGDGTPDYRDLDSDNDGVLDVVEGGNAGLDADGDGTIDAMDDPATGDLDGDGLADAANTAEVDTDGDGVPDYQDLDADNDGVLDVVDGGNTGLDADGDGTIDAMDDPATGDTDGDGLADATSTTSVDTDEDGVPDYQDLDSDNDGILDITEAGNDDLDTDGDGTIDAMDDPATGDTDGDGLADAVPATPPTDSDNDGTPDFQEIDSDNDGITDIIESGNSDLDADNNGTIDAMDNPATGDTDGDGAPDSVTPTLTDTDNDGTPDFQDLDSDNDGITDDEELGDDPSNPVDTDEDGVPDYQDLDSDNDGILDITEAGNDDLDTDGDGTIDAMDNPATGDTDGDGLADAVPATPPTDSDNDGTPDFQEIDSDNDGITDIIESGNSDLDADNNGTIDAMDNPATGDTDGDGAPDSVTPTLTDTDNDGTPDFQEVDSDDDGIPDEVEAGDDPTDPTDTDNDGTPDFQEVDSDDDGIPDTLEAGDDPTDPTDTDNDGTPDFQEVDSDGDGIPDTLEAGDDPTDPSDTDGDGTPDFQDLDADGDGTPDTEEADGGLEADFDNDGIPDWRDPVGQTVSGHVYWDLDRDGLLDGGEEDIAGVVVNLHAAGADGTLGTADDVIIRTGATASPYELLDVPDGTYHIVLNRSTLPTGQFATNDIDGATDQSITVTVAGADVVSQDFGQHYAAITGVLTDPGGTPLANASVVVTDANGSTFTTTTDANGNYLVEGTANDPITLGVATVLGTTTDGRTATNTVTLAGSQVAQADLAAPAAAQPSGPLAFTGSSISRILTLSFLLILLGIPLLYMGNRRRPNRHGDLES